MAGLRVSQLQQFFANLLEPVLPEAVACAKEPIIGLGGFFRFKLQRRELDRADKVGCLRKPVVFGTSVFVHDGVC